MVRCITYLTLSQQFCYQSEMRDVFKHGATFISQCVKKIPSDLVWFQFIF